MCAARIAPSWAAHRPTCPARCCRQRLPAPWWHHRPRPPQWRRGATSVPLRLLQAISACRNEGRGEVKPLVGFWLVAEVRRRRSREAWYDAHGDRSWMKSKKAENWRSSSAALQKSLLNTSPKGGLPFLCQQSAAKDPPKEAAAGSAGTVKGGMQLALRVRYACTRHAGSVVHCEAAHCWCSTGHFAATEQITPGR